VIIVLSPWQEEKVMIDIHASWSGIVDPSQLALLDRVHKKMCLWHGLNENGEEATHLADRAFSLFSSGVTDEGALFKTLRREALPKRVRRHFADIARLNHGDWHSTQRTP
jgi:hypothetical protein